MDAGKLTMVGEGGPELVTAGTASTVTSNTDLAKLFNTEALETKLASLTSVTNQLLLSNKNVETGVNTLVQVGHKTRVATEKTARLERNQIGLV